MKYRKKPVVIEAIPFNGKNAMEIELWSNYQAFSSPVLEHTEDNPTGHYMQIMTLEGVMTAGVGDFIIKGVNGEFYPCKPDIFEKSYEKVE